METHDRKREKGKDSKKLDCVWFLVHRQGGVLDGGFKKKGELSHPANHFH